MRAEESTETVQEVSEDLERALRESIGRLKRVIFHVEPENPQ